MVLRRNATKAILFLSATSFSPVIGFTVTSPRSSVIVASGNIIIRNQRKSQTSLQSLINADDSWGNWMVLSGAACASPWLGNHTIVGRSLGPPVTAMALVFAAASSGILTPGGSAASKSLQLLSLQLATPLILLGADLDRKTVIDRCGPLLKTFLLACFATIAACLVGWKVSGAALTKALGQDGLILAAALLAKNVGGGINYVAVCQSLGASPTAVAAGLCVDNIFALIYFPITSMLARRFPDVKPSDGTVTNSSSCLLTENSVTVQSILSTGFSSAALLWLGQKWGGKIGALPLCTFLSVLVAATLTKAKGNSSFSRYQHFFRSIQTTASTWGTVCLYLFFATAGAPGLAVADSVRLSLLPLTAFLTSLYSIHGIILWAGSAIGRIWPSLSWLAPQRLLVSSSAAIGGPATSIALAQSAGWENLRVPSLLVGNVGYAVATFCGLAYYYRLLP